MNKSSLIFGLVINYFLSCTSTDTIFKEKWTKKEAPTVFKARFETTKGNFDIEANREWSPKAVDRLYQLITSDYYTDIAICRIAPNYVAQFGKRNDSTLITKWNSPR